MKFIHVASFKGFKGDEIEFLLIVSGGSLQQQGA